MTDPKQAPTWRFWSTSESVRNREISVMAIAETALAVLIYLWAADRFGLLLPLYIAAAIAPLVLLRSEQSIALGLKWFESWSKVATSNFAMKYFAFLTGVSFVTLPLLVIGATGSGVPPFIFWGALVTTCAVSVGVPMAFILLIFTIRILATSMFLWQGIKSMPENFRVLILCTSPAQIPELIPGLNDTKSEFSFAGFRQMFFPQKDSDEVYLGHKFKILGGVAYLVWAIILFTPAWLYRVSIKSTVWFWWPLAFLGGNIRLAGNPLLLQFKLTGNWLAKASIIVAVGSLLGMLVVNFVYRGVILEDNPLISPIGYFFLFDWTLRPWQACALATSVLTVCLAFWSNDVIGRIRIGDVTGDPALISRSIRELAWVERVSRLRFLFAVALWILVGVHALLYVNSQRWCFRLPTHFEALVTAVYTDRLPKNDCDNVESRLKKRNLRP